MANKESGLVLKNKTYDFLNVLVRYILPALGTLYFGLSQLWGLPAAEEVVGSIVLISTFLGVVIGFARKGWKVDDELMIYRDEIEEFSSFGFKQDGRLIEHLEDGQTVTLRVKTYDNDDFEENA